LLVSGTRGGTVQLWDLNSGQCIHILEGHTGSVSRAEFSANRSLLATGQSGGEIRLWNVESG
ncbi:uncharacterized protein BDZ99DRAFT_341740, partial [Mytilinidion resinicola]